MHISHNLPRGLQSPEIAISHLKNFLSFQSRKSTEYARREIGALVAPMNRDVPATMDQCTQTPFPGSELLDPNPFSRAWSPNT